MPDHSPPAADKEESIIIVSDVHLGGNIGSHHNKFCDFLAWINTFPQNVPGIPCKEKEDPRPSTLDIEFAPLTKLVLIGDIIDLWDPKDQDRKNVILESIRPFSLLHTLPCDKVYVTGNHDADLWEMVKDDKSPNKRSFPWADGYDFSIYPRHYPPSEKTSADKTTRKVNRASFGKPDALHLPPRPPVRRRAGHLCHQRDPQGTLRPGRYPHGPCQHVRE